MSKILLFVVFCFFPLFADAVKDLQTAKNFYQQGRYLDAIPLFGSIVEGYSNYDQKEEALAYLAETQIRLGRVEKSLISVEEYELRYASGKFIESIEFVKARIELYEGLSGRACARLLRILANTKDKFLYQKVSEQLQEVLASATLGLDEMNRLVQEKGLAKDIILPLRRNFADRLAKEGRYKSATYYYQWLLKDYPEYKEKIEKKLIELKTKGEGKGVLLIVAPMNGLYSDFGAMVAQGVALAFEESGRQDLSFQLIDSRGEPAYTVAKIQRLMQVENVVGVIGPIMSDNAAAVAAWMSVATPEIPMITPTATDRNIAHLGKNIFQLNVPVYRMAADIAKYTAKCLNKKQTVILAPRTSYGRIMSEGFSEEFEHNGGQVLTVAFYNEGESDYNKVFNSLRHLALQMRKKELAKKFNSSDISGVMSRKDVDRWMADSTVTFESVFIAASDPVDAAILSKQLHFAKIKGPIVGSSGWNGKDVIRQGGRDIADVVFSVGFFEDKSNENFVNFAKAFRKRWDQYPDPDRVSGLSYDAAKLMLREIGENPQKTLENLRKVKGFTGVYGAFSLNNQGENINSQLVKIENFKFTPVSFCTQ